MLKKFNQFIYESTKDNDLGSEDESGIDIKSYDDIKIEISEMIDDSLEISNFKSKEEFIENYVKNPEEGQIEGLINDSDIYEFYLKHRNDIDEILSEIKFYDEIPSEINVYSLYSYIIEGTKKAVSEIISMM